MGSALEHGELVELLLVIGGAKNQILLLLYDWGCRVVL
jgi:hypothetical protein